MSWNEEATWIADERPWAAPDPALPHAVLDECGETRAWVRDAADAEMVAHARGAWPRLFRTAAQMLAQSDQLDAMTADMKARLEAEQKAIEAMKSSLDSDVRQLLDAAVETATAILREQLEAERRAVAILWKDRDRVG